MCCHDMGQARYNSAITLTNVKNMVIIGGIPNMVFLLPIWGRNGFDGGKEA